MADPVNGENILWSYIENLYSNINTARTNFNIGTTIAVPSNPEIIDQEEIQTIQNYFTDFKANTYINADSSATTAINSITVPQEQDIITPLPLQETLDIINTVCQYNSSYNSGYNTSYNTSYNSGYNSSVDSTLRSGYNSSYNTSYNTSYNSTVDSYNSSYCSSNNTSHFSTYNSTQRSSNNTAYFSTQNSSLKGSR